VPDVEPARQAPPAPAAPQVEALPLRTVLGEELHVSAHYEDLGLPIFCLYRLDSNARAAGLRCTTPDAARLLSCALIAHLRAVLLHAALSAGPSWAGQLSAKHLAAAAAERRGPLRGMRQRLHERAGVVLATQQPGILPSRFRCCEDYSAS
jgi:hypothetical protein